MPSRRDDLKNGTHFPMARLSPHASIPCMNATYKVGTLEILVKIWYLAKS